MLGGTSPGSMHEFLKLAKLKEAPGQLINGEEALASLAADHETCVRTLRKMIEKAADKSEDAGSADFLTGLLRGHEKTAWMLRSHLL